MPASRARRPSPRYTSRRSPAPLSNSHADGYRSDTETTARTAPSPSLMGTWPARLCTPSTSRSPNQARPSRAPLPSRLRRAPDARRIRGHPDEDRRGRRCRPPLHQRARRRVPRRVRDSDGGGGRRSGLGRSGSTPGSPRRRSSVARGRRGTPWWTGSPRPPRRRRVPRRPQPLGTARNWAGQALPCSTVTAMTTTSFASSRVTRVTPGASIAEHHSQANGDDPHENTTIETDPYPGVPGRP